MEEKLKPLVDREEFEKVVNPVIEYLNNLGRSPHTTITITQSSAELSEGLISTVTYKFIKN